MHRHDDHWLPLSAPAAQIWALDDVVRSRPQHDPRVRYALRRAAAQAAAIVVGLARTRTSRLHER